MSNTGRTDVSSSHPKKGFLLIASRNRGKVREIGAMLATAGIRVMNLDDFDELDECIEDGETFEHNARKKALHYASLTGMYALADDSGIEVDALGGRPGVYSARYAGPDANDTANNARLVEELRDIDEEERTARYRAVIVLASPGEVLCTSQGTLEGRIIDQPRGTGGFGYDPHFLLPDRDMTTAEITADEKNAISHRGQALRYIKPCIVKYCSL